jgi:phosphohistidine phosphatase SixA
MLRLATALPLAGALALAGRPLTTQAAGAVWDALREGGKVALIRHADAPGNGDPPTFVLEDCSTQRNLSAGGQAQAARIGAAFRANGVSVGQVLTSGWCRCIETATLAFGPAEVWPALHSFLRDAGTEAAQTAQVRARVAAWNGPGTLVLVTHQVNVTALTDIFPAAGEIIALAPAAERGFGFSIVGRVTVS